MYLPNKFTAQNIDNGVFMHFVKQSNGDYEVTWDNGKGPYKSYYNLQTILHWLNTYLRIVDAPKDESMLDKIKAFTKGKDISVVITDGKYEVYSSGANIPAKASTDDELEKLMQAIDVVYEAIITKG